MTKVLDDDQIDSIIRPVDDSRFEDLYKRLQYLRIKSTSKFSPRKRKYLPSLPRRTFSKQRSPSWKLSHGIGLDALARLLDIKIKDGLFSIWNPFNLIYVFDLGDR